MAIEAVIQETIRETDMVQESPFYIPMTGPALTRTEFEL